MFIHRFIVTFMDLALPLQTGLVFSWISQLGAYFQIKWHFNKLSICTKLPQDSELDLPAHLVTSYRPLVFNNKLSREKPNPVKSNFNRSYNADGFASAVKFICLKTHSHSTDHVIVRIRHVGVTNLMPQVHQTYQLRPIAYCVPRLKCVAPKRP